MKTVLNCILLVLILVCIFRVFIYYKIHVKRCADINTFYSICYDNRFESGLYRINGLDYDDNNPEYNGCELFKEYIIIENKMYLNSDINQHPYKRFYVVDLFSSLVLKLDKDSVIHIKSGKIKVQDLEYESPYWYLVFN